MFIRVQVYYYKVTKTVMNKTRKRIIQWLTKTVEQRFQSKMLPFQKFQDSFLQSQYSQKLALTKSKNGSSEQESGYVAQ